MIPQPGQNITIIFRNGIQLEGEVISWSDNKSEIKALTGTSIIVIQKTLNDVLYFKINNAKTQFEELKSKTHKTEEDLRELVDLKADLIDIERSEIRDRLITHTPNNIGTASYGLPKHLQVKSPLEHPREKATRTDSRVGAALQDLFGKKV